MSNVNDIIIRRMVVACLNASGQPEMFAVKVSCTKAQLDDCRHYQTAREAASDRRFEPCLEIDQDDYAGKQLAALFDWDSVETVSPYED